MGHSEDESMVRVDFFKPSGKWTGGYFANDENIHAAFVTSLTNAAAGSERLNGLLAVCLEPYHEHAHPLTHLCRFPVSKGVP